MLWVIVVILTIAWLVGFMSSVTMGGFLHILLVLAVILLVFDLVQKKKSSLETSGWEFIAW